VLDRGQLCWSGAPDRQQAVDAVPGVVEVEIVLEAAEERQHLAEGPPVAAQVSPLVIILGRSA
jgi:hypothetical protein